MESVSTRQMGPPTMSVSSTRPACRSSRKYWSGARHGASPLALLRLWAADDPRPAATPPIWTRLVPDLEAASLVGFGLKGSILLGIFPGLVRIAENPTPLARQRGVAREGPPFDEIVIGQSVRNPIDGTRALVEVGQFAAVLQHALLNVLDASGGGVVVPGTVILRRCIRPAQGGGSDERQKRVASGVQPSPCHAQPRFVPPPVPDRSYPGR